MGRALNSVMAAAHAWGDAWVTDEECHANEKQKRVKTRFLLAIVDHWPEHI